MTGFSALSSSISRQMTSEANISHTIMNNFVYHNPTKLVFGHHHILNLTHEVIFLGFSGIGGYKKLIPTAKYEFQEPVLYEFIQSGFEDFELFVDAIKTGE